MNLSKYQMVAKEMNDRMGLDPAINLNDLEVELIEQIKENAKELRPDDDQPAKDGDQTVPGISKEAKAVLQELGIGPWLVEEEEKEEIKKKGGKKMPEEEGAKKVDKKEKKATKEKAPRKTSAAQEICNMIAKHPSWKAEQVLENLTKKGLTASAVTVDIHVGNMARAKEAFTQAGLMK